MCWGRGVACSSLAIPTDFQKIKKRICTQILIYLSMSSSNNGGIRSRNTHY